MDLTTPAQWSRSGGRSTGPEPVERVYQLAPGAAPAQALTERQAVAAPPVEPPIDIDRLDRDLWRRFEKRIRVERERRGRT